MKVLLNPQNVVVAKSAEAEEKPNGILMDGIIYAEQCLTLIDTDLDPRVQKDKIVDGAIVENENYIDPTTIQR